MNSIVRKWGNSLAVRIPRSVARDTHLMEGTAVVLTASRGKIVIEPYSQPRYSLAELLRGVAKRNLHPEIDTGEAVGREVW